MQAHKLIADTSPAELTDTTNPEASASVWERIKNCLDYGVWVFLLDSNDPESYRLNACSVRYYLCTGCRSAVYTRSCTRREITSACALPGTRRSATSCARAGRATSACVLR